jgi:hypothetical protein
MPSARHQGIVRLFHRNPHLAADLLRLLAAEHKLPAYEKVIARDSVLQRAELFPDLVFHFADADHKPVLALAVEVQLSAKKQKKLVWPEYTTILGASLRCPACVLVVSPNTRTARWASKPIPLGPGSSVRPLVVGPDQIPWINDEVTAVGQPELAVLSALAHGNEPGGLDVVLAALEALAECFDRDDEARYSSLIEQALTPPTRQALEDRMDLENRKQVREPRFWRRIKDLGRTEGKAEGKVEGEAKGKAEALLKLLRRRGIELAPEDTARIRACRDLTQLDAWFDQAFTVKSAAELFVAP